MNQNIKIKKLEPIFYKTFGEKQPTWKELKDVELQDDDLVTISYEEAHYSENNSYDGHWFIDVQRQREETDEEYEKRMKENENSREMLKKMRYKQYLKLKEEFEK
jgi:ribosomal protein L14E/L6E/L27E